MTPTLVATRTPQFTKEEAEQAAAIVPTNAEASDYILD